MTAAPARSSALGDFTVPSPRPRLPSGSTTSSAAAAAMPIPSALSNPSSPSSVPRDRADRGDMAPPPMHVRRPSLNLPPSILSTSPRAVPVPVPNRGPVPSHRLSFGGTSPSERSLAGGSLSGSWMGTGSAGVSRKSSQSHSHAKSGSIGGLSSSIHGLPSSPLSDHGPGSGSSSRSTGAGLTIATGATGAAGGLTRRVSMSAREEPRAEERAMQEREIMGRVDSEEGRKWLSVTAAEIVKEREESVKLVEGDMGMEQAVEVLLKSGGQCLLVDLGSDYAFFDFADLNTFLLLVLLASSTTPSSSRSPPRAIGKHNRNLSFGDSAIAEEDEAVSSSMDERSEAVVKRLRKGDKVVVRDVCDISQKNPYSSYPSASTLATLLPLFANGLHRLAIQQTSGPPKVISDAILLEHLGNLDASLQPPLLHLAVSSPSLQTPLRPLISLPGTASVLDAMQVMSRMGLSALGVLSGSGGARSRRESSGSSGSSTSTGSLRRQESGTAISGLLTASPKLMPIASPGLDSTGMNPLDSGAGVGAGGGELVAVVTAAGCTRLVVPSEGKQVLGMGLEEMVKGMQYIEEAGRDRGEERVPVHTIPYSSTLMHAAHIILATSSCRVFLRSPPSNAPLASPSLSPVPSLTTSFSSPLSSPSLSSLSLSDQRLSAISNSALPPPPPTLLSPHYVVSTADILAALAKAYSPYLTPAEGHVRVRGSIDSTAAAMAAGTGGLDAGAGLEGVQGWKLDPDSLARRRRASSGASLEDGGGGVGFESWRWAGRVSRG